MTWELAMWALVAGAGVMLSAFFSGVETGLYIINRVRLTVRANHGETAATTLRRILSHPTRMLGTILIGNNIANYVGTFGVAAMLDRLGVGDVRALVINAAVLIPLLFVFGEVLPKDLFRTHTDRWSYRCAGFLNWIQRLLQWSGLLWIALGFGTLVSRLLGGSGEVALKGRQRMSQLFKEGLGAGVLSESQSTLADRALALRGRTVEMEMIPWRHTVSVRLDSTRRELDLVLGKHSFTRYPVIDEAGQVKGVLTTLAAVISPDSDVHALTEGIVMLNAQAPIHDALRRMREQRSRLAVVVTGSDDRPVGIVTLKDLVEPLTGELQAW